jgi:hypothetical protein
MNKPTAVFIGADHMVEPVFHDVASRLHVAHHSQWESGLKAIEMAGPCLVMVSGTAEHPDSSAFFDHLRRQIPHSLTPAVAVDLMARRITVERWDQGAGAFTKQVRPIDELTATVDALLEPAVAPEELAALRDEGFYNHVPVAERTLHVQTEVLTRDFVRIKSTVLEGGRILYGTSQVLPLDVEDVARAKAIVRAQHDAVMAQVVNKRW